VYCLFLKKIGRNVREEKMHSLSGVTRNSQGRVLAGVWVGAPSHRRQRVWGRITQQWAIFAIFQ